MKYIYGRSEENITASVILYIPRVQSLAFSGKSKRLIIRLRGLGSTRRNLIIGAWKIYVRSGPCGSSIKFWTQLQLL